MHYGMADEGRLGGNETAAAVATAAAKVGGGMAMTAKERATAFAHGP
jgi:hypothetical protein